MSDIDRLKGLGVTYKLENREVFDNLANDEAQDGIQHRAYAHHLSRACWHGGRIRLRQTSPEPEGIFEFIIALHKDCNGQWEKLLDTGVTQAHLNAWLEFAGMLSSLDNHYDNGDRKVVPNVSADVLRRMAAITPEATSKLEEILDTMLAVQPSNLGYPSETCPSSYYPSKDRVNHQEAEAVTKLMVARKIAPENTRLAKITCSRASGTEDFVVFEILQASAETDNEPRYLAEIEVGGKRRAKVFLRRGDHSVEMTKICTSLADAVKYAVNDTQRLALSQLIQTFRTGGYQGFPCGSENVGTGQRAPG